MIAYHQWHMFPFSKRLSFELIILQWNTTQETPAKEHPCSKKQPHYSFAETKRWKRKPDRITLPWVHRPGRVAHFLPWWRQNDSSNVCCFFVVWEVRSLTLLHCPLSFCSKRCLDQIRMLIWILPFTSLFFRFRCFKQNLIQGLTWRTKADEPSCFEV